MKRISVLALVFMLLVLSLISCKKAANDNAAKEERETMTEATQSDVSVTQAADSVTTAPTQTPAVPAAETPTAVPEAANDSASNDSIYKDGVYTIKTNVDVENYYTEATVTIDDGKIKSADWWIYNVAQNNMRFDEEYYHSFEPNEEYVKQAKDDWSGSRNYAVKLLETQNVNQIDAISGATWSYIEFEEAINLALKQATQDMAPAYKDGIYEGETAIDVDKYYAKASVTVEGGKITKVDWNIYDSARGDAVFSKDYLDDNITTWEKDEFMNDMNGLGGYADQLIETQNIYQVDAVTGATWSNIKFRQAVDNALTKAKE